MRVAILLVSALALQVPQVLANTVPQPCSPGASIENIFPLTNGVTTYCISDFGWSDTWLVGSPKIYNQTVDMFSGDDAFNLYYNAPPTGRGAGMGWLSPSMDKGTLKAQVSPSNWHVVTAVHATGAYSAESVIANADGLRITIDSTSLGSGVTIGLTIKNTSISPITGLQLADYFNFHPNGSQEPNDIDGTTSIQNGCVVTTGIPGPTFLMNGFMCGLRAPDHFEVGPDDGLNPVWMDVQNLAWLNNTGPVGPGGTAGALEWDLGTLAAGGSVFFEVGKNTKPIVAVPSSPSPEPGSFVLLFCGAALLLCVHHRRHPVRHALLPSTPPRSSVATPHFQDSTSVHTTACRDAVAD